MALPTTGQISIKTIAEELGNVVGSGGGYSATNITNTLYGTGGLTQIVASSEDDTNVQITAPFTVWFDGSSYSSVFVGSNSYITFGGGSNAYSVGPSNPPLPAIMIGAADNSYQRVYYGTIDGGATFIIRFEGTSATNGTPGSPNMVWEVRFNNSNQNIDVHVGVNNRGIAVSGLKTSNAWIIQPSGFGNANTSFRFTRTTSISNISLRGLEIGSYGAINQSSPLRPNGLSPYAISEFRGYNHSAVPTSIALNSTTNNFLKSSGGITWISNIVQTSSFSIVGWMRLNGAVPTAPWYPFHTRPTSSTSFTGNNIWIRIGSSVTLQFGMSGTSVNSIARAVPSIGVWFHLAVTYNGSNKQAIMYYNGAQSTSGTFSSLGNMTTTSRNLAIGGLAGSDNTNNSANMTLDNMGFYNKVLSAAEVTTIYNNRQPYNLANISNLQDSWTFESSNGNSTNGTANLSNIGTPTYSTITTYGT